MSHDERYTKLAADAGHFGDWKTLSLGLGNVSP